MSNKVKVKITSQDIKNGRHGSCGNCPIALAVKRTFKVKAASVTDSITFTKELKHGGTIQYDIPVTEKISRFTEAFDGYEKVKPISFYLPVR